MNSYEYALARVPPEADMPTHTAVLRIVHGILSSAKPYDAKVDDANQQKQIAAIEECSPKNLKMVRRFQTEDFDAPISRIEKKEGCLRSLRPA